MQKWKMTLSNIYCINVPLEVRSNNEKDKIKPCLVTTLINFLFFATFLIAQIIVLALIIDKGFGRADKGFSIDA